jgi:hypothetical protein
VDVHGARIARERVPPDALEQLVARQHDPAVVEELPEEVELLRSQLDLVVSDEHLATTRVDEEIAVADLVALVDAAIRRRPPEHALDARDELTRIERLRQVVVRADLEPDDLVDVLVARREHQDRDVGALADAAADLDPVHVRQVQVEHDQGRHLGGDRVERPRAGADRADAVAGVLEVERDERGDRLLVLDDEHGLRLTAHGTTLAGLSAEVAPKSMRAASFGIGTGATSPTAYVPVAPVRSGFPSSST